jgi:hypothetical protein
MRLSVALVLVGAISALADDSGPGPSLTAHEGGRLLAAEAVSHGRRQQEFFAALQEVSANGDEEAACKNCTMVMGNHIFAAAEQFVEKKCSSASCDETEDVHQNGASCHKKQNFCKFWRREPKVARGFLIPHINPLRDGWFFCAGNGTCHPQKRPLEDMMLVEDASSDLVDVSLPEFDMLSDVAELIQVSGAEWEDKRPRHRLPRHSPKPWWRALKERVSSWFPEWSVEQKHIAQDSGEWEKVHTEDSQTLHSWQEAEDRIMVPQVKGVWRHCYKMVFRIVMAHSVSMVKKQCRTTHCPKMQGFCKWARWHREMAYGVLLAKVEPWKYALGRCYHPGKGIDKGKGDHGKDKNDKGKHHHKGGKGEGKPEVSEVIV